MCALEELKIVAIGVIDNGIDGVNRFYEVRPLADDISMEEVRATLEEGAQCYSAGASNMFCAGVSIVAQEHRDAVFIATVHFRYDN